MFSLLVALIAHSVAAQFLTSQTQPLCNSLYSINCANFAPQDGTIILGWNVDYDRRDSISDMIARMDAAGSGQFGRPGAYGMFNKITEFGLSQNEPGVRGDMDLILDQLKGTNSIFVTSLDPVNGYDKVSQAGLEVFADKISAFNKHGIPVLIRPAHEMNGPWYAYGQQPLKFKQFYINVYNTVKAKAPHAKFIFAPNLGPGYPWKGIPPKTPLTNEDIAAADTNKNGIIDENDDPYLPYYPGNQYVDWFGASMYWKGDWPYVRNQASYLGLVPDQLSQVLGGGVSTYEFARVRNLPIIFPEMGASYCPTNPGVSNLETKRLFWHDVFRDETRQRFPLLKMALWFDYNKFEDDAQRDFSISGAPDSIAQVAPTFKQDISKMQYIVYASNLELSSTANCGCFKYNSAGDALNVVVTPSPKLGEGATCTSSAQCANGCCSNQKCTTGGTQCIGVIPTITIPSPTPGKLGDWQLCTSNVQCANNCCSTQYSDDGKFKCTPGGSPELCTGQSTGQISATTLATIAQTATRTTVRTSSVTSPTPAKLTDWSFCTTNSQCANNCCSREYSSDGQFKCTPGGNPAQCTGVTGATLSRVITTTTTRASPTVVRTTTTLTTAVSNSPTKLGDWAFCTLNSQCINNCCSVQYSNDGVYKCTPGGTLSQCTGTRTSTIRTITTTRATTTARGTTTTLRPSTITTSPVKLADWAFCTANSQCSNNCCSKQYSGDGAYKCTPGGTLSQCTGVPASSIRTTTTRRTTTTTISPATSPSTNLSAWSFCTRSSQCVNRCCSRQYSGDGRYKCTPGGTICV